LKDLEPYHAGFLSLLGEKSLKENSHVFKELADLCREALGSSACTLVLINPEQKSVAQVACSVSDKDFEAFVSETLIGMESFNKGNEVDDKLLGNGEVIERYDLQQTGQGAANLGRYGLNSVLSHPLKSNERVVGYINHFSSQKEPFTAEEKRLLENIARQTVITLEGLEHSARLSRSLSAFKNLTHRALSVSLDDFLSYVARTLCEFLSVPICVIWRLNEEHNKLSVVASHGDVDDEYKRIVLDVNRSGVHRPPLQQPVGQDDLSGLYANHEQRDQVRKRGWASLLTAPIYADNQLMGMLDLYTLQPRQFKEWEREWFSTCADQIGLNLRKAELLRKSEGLFANNLRLEFLNRVAREMTEVHDVDQLLRLLLNRSLELVKSGRGSVSSFDPRTGDLNTVAHRSGPTGAYRLELGRGITGKSLLEEKAIRVNDVRSPEWQGVYEQFWEDTHSELAIPIFISSAQIRLGHEIKSGTKPIGVLNIESPVVGAFSQDDEDILSLMTRQAAIIIERLEVDRKFANLRKIEREIAGKRDWDETIRIVLAAITNTLGYDYVNISLVDLELNRIKAKYVVGIPQEEVELFKRMADHTLDSDDIQAQIVRSRETEVPDIADPRFDQRIYERFGHERLIRVFIPMIVASEDRVIGTVEAGYKRSYRRHIYERDVQILRGFVNYAVRALEQSKKGLLPKISHELRAPIVGIRSNASFLQLRRHQLDSTLVEIKLDDILSDSEILLLRVAELEHILGGTTPVSRPELTLVFRDIVIKTLNQLKPLVAERRFDMSMIQYNTLDINRIRLYVDRARLNSVVSNLLLNSIKYAEDDPSLFKMMISVDETKNHYIIKFKDWGIGVKKQYQERIFEDGFRAPEAINRFVTGSGLGLTIARKTMREMDGDLRLANNHKPTEFDLILPKSLKEMPDDSVHR
jgi:signal transduction histidine kinase/putative methionine-R-sulfoxide reductase with GAF domain